MNRQLESLHERMHHRFPQMSILLAIMIVDKRGSSLARGSGINDHIGLNKF